MIYSLFYVILKSHPIIIAHISEKAKKAYKHIVLAEGEEERIIIAASRIADL